MFMLLFIGQVVKCMIFPLFFVKRNIFVYSSLDFRYRYDEYKLRIICSLRNLNMNRNVI